MQKHGSECSHSKDWKGTAPRGLKMFHWTRGLHEWSREGDDQEVRYAVRGTISLGGKESLPDSGQRLRLFLYHHFYHQSRVSIAGGAPESAATGAGWHGSGNRPVL